jgi:uroporphyrinogen-III synthase
MPTNKISVLCTRLLDGLLLNKAIDKNIYVDAVPFIQTEAINTSELINEIQAISLKKITAVFTSMNAVEAISNHIINKPGWNIFCLGGITKESVSKTFHWISIAGTAKHAATLADRILHHEEIKEVVFFCGDHRLDELPDILRSHNIAVKELVVYSTIQTPVFIERNYDAIIFFSPSAVHSFFSMNTIATDVVLFSIGKTTTATIRSYCANPVITSEWPGKEQMIENVVHYFSDPDKMN